MSCSLALFIWCSGLFSKVNINRCQNLGKNQLGTFLRSSSICLHQKWDETWILSPQSECTRWVKNFQTNQDLGSYESIKSKKNPICPTKSRKISIKTSHRKTYFTWVRKFVDNLFSMVFWGRSLALIFSVDFSLS